MEENMVFLSRTQIRAFISALIIIGTIAMPQTQANQFTDWVTKLQNNANSFYQKLEKKDIQMAGLGLAALVLLFAFKAWNSKDANVESTMTVESDSSFDDSNQDSVEKNNNDQDALPNDDGNEINNNLSEENDKVKTGNGEESQQLSVD